MNDTTNILMVPLIIGLLEVIKRAEVVNTKYIPLISVLIGGILGITVNGLNTNGILLGITYGLSATGLYTSVKKYSDVTNEEKKKKRLFMIYWYWLKEIRYIVGRKTASNSCLGYWTNRAINREKM